MKVNLKRKIDFVIIALLTSIAVGVGGIYFLATAILQSEKEVDKINTNIESEYLRRERYNDLLATYQGIQEENIATNLSKMLPSESNFLDVVRELENLAKESGNQLTMRLGEAKLTSEGVELATGETGRTRSVTANVQTGGRNFDYVEIEATVRGNYTELRKFIYFFSQAKYFMNINSIVINRIEGGAGPDYIDTQLTIRIFVEKLIRTQRRAS